MFTGIIEELGTVVSLTPFDKLRASPNRSPKRRGVGNLSIVIEASFADELKVDQSVAHNGACLTVVNCKNKKYTVTAIEETLSKTNLGLLKTGDKINLERSMLMNGRVDGHLVQGHVDCTAICTSIKNLKGSWIFNFEIRNSKFEIEKLIIEKGSVCVNGVSLTVVESKRNSFSVAIIPYTFEHTNFRLLKKGGIVNIEFDIIGKYVAKMLSHKKKTG